jgi:hypothetical protein
MGKQSTNATTKSNQAIACRRMRQNGGGATAEDSSSDCVFDIVLTLAILLEMDHRTREPISAIVELLPVNDAAQRSCRKTPSYRERLRAMRVEVAS